MPEWLGTAILVAVIVAICTLAVVSYGKKLSKGCCGTAGDKEKRIAPKQGEYPHHVTVTVGGMTCEKCAVRIENGFNRLDGVSAAVDHRTGTVEIRSREPLTALVIRKTIIELGYTVESISEPPKN